MATKQPIDLLAEAITKSLTPFSQAVLGLTAEMRRLNERLDGSAAPLAGDEGEDDAEEPAPPKPRSTTIDFDMESAIRAAGKWECEGATFTPPATEEDPEPQPRQLKCSDCTTEQNLDCLNTYGLMEDAERSAGKHSDGSEEQTRLVLHRLLRGNGHDPIPDEEAAAAVTVVTPKPDVPVERLMRFVPRVPQPTPAAAASAVETETAKAKGGRPKGSKNKPKEPLKATVAERTKAKAKAATPKAKGKKGKR